MLLVSSSAIIHKLESSLHSILLSSLTHSSIAVKARVRSSHDITISAMRVCSEFRFLEYNQSERREFLRVAGFGRVKEMEIKQKKKLLGTGGSKAKKAAALRR